MWDNLITKTYIRHCERHRLEDAIGAQRARELHSFTRFYADELPHIMAQAVVLLERVLERAVALWDSGKFREPVAATEDASDATTAALAARAAAEAASDEWEACSDT